MVRNPQCRGSGLSLRTHWPVSSLVVVVPGNAVDVRVQPVAEVLPGDNGNLLTRSARLALAPGFTEVTHRGQAKGNVPVTQPQVQPVRLTQGRIQVQQEAGRPIGRDVTVAVGLAFGLMGYRGWLPPN